MSPRTMSILSARALTARAARSTTSHLSGACNEDDRANDPLVPAKIRCVRVSREIRPNAAAAEFLLPRIVVSFPPTAHRARGERQSPDFAARPRRPAARRADENENISRIL